MGGEGERQADTMRMLPVLLPFFLPIYTPSPEPEERASVRVGLCSKETAHGHWPY